jgi:hypothetical protein
VSTTRPGPKHGLWGSIFGDKSVGTANTLFFSAGIADEAQGLLGTLTPGHGRERDSAHQQDRLARSDLLKVLGAGEKPRDRPQLSHQTLALATKVS